ncbi:hypothetical protein QFC20_002421 [Naganishia adeliensis]|uniref:Uncharacterized protein n=1 Tax=Naganishia adeliensis TaxID=92952 RepID=A0ACC2WJC9_9TREE|nr:hypothetical protein QFC20_002421 [Naganishia adeliensis]
MAPLHPEILYAQRSSESEAEKNIIYFTIQTPDVQGEPELKIEPKKITFSAKAGDASKGVPEREYQFDLDLYDEIIPEETKKSVTSRAIVLILRKKQLQAEFWPRLTKEKVKNNWIKTDFSKWVDEDEQDEAEAVDESQFQGMGGSGGPGGRGPPGGMGGMDMASMMGGGGMGGMGGMDMASMMGGGGAGGPGGMDMASLMAQMQGGQGGAGGMGGGAGGMDMASLMAQMQGGQGGAGGPGAGGEGAGSNIDFEALMKQMGQNQGSMPDFGDDDDDEDEAPSTASAVGGSAGLSTETNESK